jgi:cytochrome c556|tara:strand:+ start:354 stop:815 length:462 start_codon:yes stop_codon:yes gene_type:complete
MTSKYITKTFKYIFFLLAIISFSFPVNSESSIEEIIKGRKALFSKNYSTAKKVQSFASKGDFEKAKSLMMEMSKNYKILLKYFPENSKEGFKTEALQTIWDNKDEFNNLMSKSSNDMIELAAVVESSEDIKATIGKLMWANCKACHTKFRAPH